MLEKTFNVLAVLLVCTSGFSRAAEVAVFDDGRALVVSSWELKGRFTVLQLESGGRISIPSDRIVSIKPFEQAAREQNGSEKTSQEQSWRRWAGEYADIIHDAARKHSLDPSLLTAMVRVESNFDPFAVSSKGACGLMQLVPETAERFGVQDIFDPRQNIEGGARYMRWLLDRFEGRTDLALAAYNAGETVVDQYRGIPPYPETRSYVSKVLDRAGG